MKKAEAMCEEKGMSCAVLMRNVGSAVALHISRIAKPCHTAVLVGSGNNGGDGVALAQNPQHRLRYRVASKQTLKLVVGD